MKFLIDECLSPSLVELAILAGHPESAHVIFRGMAGWSDNRVMLRILAEDWTLVTRNSDDFRPRSGSSSRAPCYVGQPLHAGLVCLNLPANTGRSAQRAYFSVALAELGVLGDLVNQVLEVDPVEGQPGRIALNRYDFPGCAGASG